MKILLIEPFISDFYSSPKRMSSLGLISIYNELYDLSFSEVSIISFFNIKGKIKKVPDEFSYLKNYLIQDSSSLSFFSSYKRFGKSYKAIKQIIIDYNPDIVGISAFSVCYYKDIAEIANMVKSYNSSIFIISGGPGISSFLSVFESIGDIDLLITGNNTDNICKVFKDHKRYNNRIYHSGYSDSISLISNYSFVRYPISIVMTKGCPKKCSFCSIPHISGPRLLMSYPEQLKSLLDRIKHNKIWLNFEDDNISYDNEYFNYILEIIKTKRKAIDISLTFMNGLDYSTMNEGTIIALKEAGLKYLNLTIASINESARAKIKRFQDVHHLDRVFGWLAKYNIDIIAYFICGIPEITIDEDIETLKYLIRSRALIGISPYYPVSENSMEIIRNRPDPSLYRGSAMYPFNSKYTTKSLITLFKLTRLFNLFKSGDKQLINSHKTMIKMIIKNGVFYYKYNNSYKIYPTEKDILAEFIPDIERLISSIGL